MKMQVQILSRAEAHCVDVDAWRLLAHRAVVPNPFYERWALLPALRFLEPKADIFLIVVLVDGTLSCLMPVKYYKGKLGVRYLSMWKYQDCYLTDPLFLPELDLDEIFRKAIELFGVCCFMSPSHTASTRLTSRSAVCVVRERGAIVRRLSWRDYEALQPRKIRKENKRVMGRLMGLEDAEYVVSSKGLVSDWFPRFARLEKAGWKGRGGWAIEQDGDRSLFLDEVMRAGEREEKIEFQALVAENNDLAIAFRFITRGCSFEVKTTFNENYSRFYPGVVLELLNVKDLLGKDIIIADSCAANNNRLINRVWPDRRNIYKTVEFVDSIGGRGGRWAYMVYRRFFALLGNRGSASRPCMTTWAKLYLSDSNFRLFISDNLKIFSEKCS